MLSARINNYTINTPEDLIPEDFKGLDIPRIKANKFLDLLKKRASSPFSNASKSFIPGHVDHVFAADMTPKMFYQSYLALNKPVFVQEGCADWPAMTKWSDQAYLAD